MGGATPGQVALGCIRKWAEQALRSKLVNNVPLWPLPQFLPQGPVQTSLSDEL